MGRKYGKYQKKPRKIPLVSWILLAVVVISLSTGTVMAWLSITGGSVENVFDPAASVDPSISETFDKEVKSNVAVSVGDTGYAVYVRAAIVVTWKAEEDGSVLGDSPVLNEDYTLLLNETDWFLKDGFYYHKAAVNSGGTTANLITSCQLKSSVIPPSGYALNVEIIAQTIQALGTTDEGNSPAVAEAWGVTVTGGNLSS